MAERKKTQREPLPADPAERFRAVATRRVNNAIASIRSIGSVAGKDYKYTDEQATAITDTLATEVENLNARLQSRSAVKSGGFTVGD